VPGVEIGGGAGRRADDTVLGATVPTLPVDHHGAGEDEPPGEAAPGQGGEEPGGGQIVVGHVARGVAEVDTEADARRMV
jgi:hypothetical protein